MAVSKVASQKRKTTRSTGEMSRSAIFSTTKVPPQMAVAPRRASSAPRWVVALDASGGGFMDFGL